MNTCSTIRPQLGEYLDGELGSARRAEVQDHVRACASCRAELDELSNLALALAPAAPAPVPDGLWVSLEQELERTPSEARSPMRLLRLPRARLATAAAVIFAAGLGLIALTSYDRQAGASEIDFSVLLDALRSDVDNAFARFVAHNKGQRTTPQEIRRYAPGLTFATPEELPGGFRLKEVYALRVGDNPGIAARYERDGEFLAAIFHPPVKREDFGSHKDYPCVIGKHRGHAVAVGDWKLVHLTDPTTCHCVLSRLDEHTELPAVMRMLAPGVLENGDPAPDHTAHHRP